MSEIYLDEPDRGEVLRLMRPGLEKNRGYASYWCWMSVKRFPELDAARILRNHLLELGEPVSGNLSKVGDKSPDVLLVTNMGRRIGIEVTELVDREQVEEHCRRQKHGQSIDYDWAEWPQYKIAREVSLRVSVKEGKFTKAPGKYDERLLAIVTDEPMIDETAARQALEFCCPTANVIDRAFLVFSYRPGSNTSVYPDGCPVLPVSLR